MKAMVLHAYGGPDQLKYEDTDVPEFGENEVLVRVRATSVNPVDYKIRSGAAKARMPVEFPAILGRDLAGEVVDAGRNVSGFLKGMRVMALANGTYAEYRWPRPTCWHRSPMRWTLKGPRRCHWW